MLLKIAGAVDLGDDLLTDDRGGYKPSPLLGYKTWTVFPFGTLSLSSSYCFVRIAASMLSENYQPIVRIQPRSTGFVEGRKTFWHPARLRAFKVLGVALAAGLRVFLAGQQISSGFYGYVNYSLVLVFG